MTSAKIDAALTAIARRKPKAVVLHETNIRITQEAIKVTKSGDLSFSRGKDADPTEAAFLIFDPKVQAYRPVLTPPGTAWELVAKKQGPSLWRPGMPA